jgi:toxin ParE1/3/4
MKIEWTQPALLDLENIRELLFYNYRIIYRFETDRILVLTIIHGARDLSLRKTKPWEIL